MNAACEAHSPEAEIAVLGGAFIDGEALPRAAEIVSDAMFYRDGNRRAFRAMFRVHQRGDALDPVTLAEELRSAGDLEAAGGLQFIASILDAVPAAANIEYHARIVRERAMERRLAAAMHEAGRDPNPRNVAAVAARAAELEQARGPAAAQRRFPLVSSIEVEQRPKPAFQVEGVLQDGGFAALAGPPGCYKTFLALAIAYAASEGLTWAGRAVKPGHVVYVAAEGTSDAGARVRALRLYAHRVGTSGRLHFVEAPVNLMDAAAVSVFLADVRAQIPEPPVLFVFDTLARCLLGGDENSARDMGLGMESAARIQRDTGGAVLLLHHTGKNGESERGSTALRGAVDTLLMMKAEDAVATLTCEKQKAFAPFERLRLEALPMGESVVLSTATRRWQQADEEPTATHLAALEALTATAMDDGASAGEWQGSADLPERTFYRARKWLVEKEFVQMEKRGNGKRYSLTSKGERAVTAALPLAAK